ncbi:MAG: hypothetical protein D5S00_02945 [Tindallia sp. MSAO_Bac2]|nr:MAG: hypothetical protein D5S00_02945 [Tindallia sp. MSAO_Bac2]
MKKTLSLKPLTALLQEKKEILRDLLDLTEKQKEMLEASGEMNQEAFLTCVEERGRMLEVVDALDKQFLEQLDQIKRESGFQQLDQAAVGTFDKEEVISLQNLTEEIQETLKKTAQLDQENREKMKALMGNLKSEIDQLQKGKKAIHGYANTKQQQPSIFLDKKEKGQS